MEQSLKLEAKLVKRTSKNGRDYKALVIVFGGYEKMIFLDQAELFLLESLLPPQNYIDDIVREEL